MGPAWSRAYPEQEENNAQCKKNCREGKIVGRPESPPAVDPFGKNEGQPLTGTVQSQPSAWSSKSLESKEEKKSNPKIGDERRNEFCPKFEGDRPDEL